jgi:hypothetical protein
MTKSEAGGGSGGTGGSGGATNDHVQLVSLNVQLNQFIYDDATKSTAPQRWAIWLKEFHMYCTAQNARDKNQQKAALLLQVGPNVRAIYYALEDTADDVDAVIEKLSVFFAPFKNTDFEVLQFDNMTQNESETIAEYVIRLRQAAKNCEFADVDKEIVRVLRRTCISTKFKEELVKTKTNKLDEILKLARTAEATRQQAKAIQEAAKSNSKNGQTSHMAAIGAKKPQFKNNYKQKYKQSGQPSSEGDKNNNNSSLKCFYCGYDYPHKTICPAKGKQCKLCKKYNHFERCCKLTNKQVNAFEATTAKEKPKMASSIVALPTQSALTGTPSGISITKMFSCKTDGGKSRVYAPVEIFGNELIVLVDSGCEQNIIDQATYEKMVTKPSLRTTNIRLKVYFYGN